MSNSLAADLRESCHTADENAVKQFLTDGADPNDCDKDGFAALHYAAAAGSLGCCRLLINSSCNINAKSKNGCTPLYMAAQCGYTKTVNELIGKGAEIDTATLSTGHTALLVACEFGYHYIVQALVTAGANVKHTLHDGFSALHIAAQYGKLDVTPMLLKSGCQVNARNKGGWTPLMVAVWHGQTPIVEVLLRAGADVNATNEAGICALTLAVAKHPTLIRQLATSNCQLNIQDKESNWTPLHYATYYGQLKAALSLIALDCDLNAKAKQGQTALHLAAARGYSSICEVLVGAGANPNMQNEHGETPLQVAANGSVQQVLSGYSATATKPSHPPSQTPLSAGVGSSASNA